MDNYYEQLTKAYKSKLYGFYNYVAIFMVLLFIFLTGSNFLISLVFLGLAVLFYFLKQNEYLEYEYIFTNGDVDIDKIISAKKRKKVANFDVKSIQVMAPEGSYNLDGAPKGKKVIAHTKNTKDKVFIAVVSKDTEMLEIHFTPDEQFINLCFRCNPRNVKKF